MDQQIGPFAHDYHTCSSIKPRGPQCKPMDKNIFDYGSQCVLGLLGYKNNNGTSPKEMIQRH